jgi:uncharacterized protein (DUF1778 family)
VLENLRPRAKEKTCKVKSIALRLDESDAKILLDAADDPTWSGKALSRALKDRGLEISDTTLLRHRDKTCPCY